MFTIKRLNHLVLYVRDAQRALRFYQDVLGFEIVEAPSPQAVFLRANGSDNHHDLGLFSVGATAPSPPQGAVGLYHLAWEVDTLDTLEGLAVSLAEADALVGMSDHGTTKSLYGHDPDGIEFEVMWELPIELMESDEPSNVPLDLDADIARFGADTPGRGG